MKYIIPLLLYGIPSVSVITMFVVNLVGFCRAPKGSDERKSKKLPLIINSIFCVIALVTITMLIIQVVNAIANK